MSTTTVCATMGGSDAVLETPADPYTAEVAAMSPEPNLFDSARAGKRSGAQERSRNHQWKGGRTVASNGYVLVKVGKDHHLADVRGYAYEHRVNAEKKIGRRLLPGEQVHHVNENKQDNRPENLEVVADIQHHRVRHRRQQRGLRLPDEPNPILECACGCGQKFEQYDAYRRPRRFISGHNNQGRVRYGSDLN